MYYEKEHWKPRTTFRCTTMQVYDPCMEPDRRIHHRRQHGHLHAYLHRQRRYFDKVLGCFWRIADHCHEIAEHNHYVQGVAWDPLNEYIATQSSDRSTHVYNIISYKSGSLEVPKHAHRPSPQSDAEHPQRPTQLPARVNRERDRDRVRDHELRPSRRSSFSGSNAPSSPANYTRYGRSPSPIPSLPAIRMAPSTSVKLYGDESFTNFFRRLTFSPDGGLLLTPAGQFEDPSVVPGANSKSNDQPTRGRK
ncbi:hypothetical protein L226DRAFT_527470, partial [Lentinus tigrinus ALCF2SS1-7]|uniref:uncharacterized protein n=1 Tax=Lentinus tigrinus ALCF2SS1-7 TaxID=1328758 RepID=UPI0011663137